jgi:hypothetical protein
MGAPGSPRRPRFPMRPLRRTRRWELKGLGAQASGGGTSGLWDEGAWLAPPPSSLRSAEQTSRAASSAKTVRLTRPVRPACSAGGTTATGWARLGAPLRWRRVLDLAVSPRTSGVPQDPAHPRRRTLMSPASPTAHDPAFSGALAGIISANAPLKPESRTLGTPEAREASARVCAGARPLAAPTRAHSVRAPLPRNRPWWGWDGCEPWETLGVRGVGDGRDLSESRGAGGGGWPSVASPR